MRYYARTASRVGDGAAVITLFVVVAICFFGTIVSIPYAGAGTGLAILLVLELPALAITALLIARRRSRRPAVDR